MSMEQNGHLGSKNLEQNHNSVHSLPSHHQSLHIKPTFITCNSDLTLKSQSSYWMTINFDYTLICYYITTRLRWTNKGLFCKKQRHNNNTRKRLKFIKKKKIGTMMQQPQRRTMIMHNFFFPPQFKGLFTDYSELFCINHFQ